jgi:hypothetical protein
MSKVARVSSLIREFRADPPLLHGGGQCWGLAWDALEWLERHLRAEMSTLETGCGLSTIVFAAAGTDHEVITVDEAEIERVRSECRAREIDDSRVRFRVAPSHEALPSSSPRPLDLALIDGAHGFPYPILDWWHLAPRVKVGGLLLVDDAFLPPVAVLVDHLKSSSAWERVDVFGDRTVVLRKRSDGLPSYEWTREKLGTGPSFRHASRRRRVLASAVYRAAETRLGRHGVRLGGPLLRRLRFR